jgi:lipid-binding SYLF domain-containing protein
MRHINLETAAILAALCLGSGAVHAGSYHSTTELFKNAAQSRDFFKKSYAYAVYPTVGEAGFLVGAAHGNGRVFSHGIWVGTTAVTQLSVGWQAGGEAFSEIIFFEDKDALNRFESGSFQFGAGANVVVITAGAAASAGTQGAAVGASGGERNAVLAGTYMNGMAVFTIVKGGLMFDASLEGERFSFVPHAPAMTRN